MSGWPRWARADAPGSLAQYVLPDLVARLTPGSLPGRSAEPAMSRLRRIYDALAAAGIDYVDEPVTSEPGLQALRPPEQVLVRPGGGTCLDVAVVAAGAALHAGLHPLVVVLDPESGTGPGHAVLVVWLDGDWAGRPDRDYPLATVVFDHPPADILADLCFTAGASGAFAAVDVAAVARHRVHGSAPAGEPIPTFDEALAAGATMLTSGAAATGSAATFTGGTVGGRAAGRSGSTSASATGPPTPWPPWPCPRWIRSRRPTSTPTRTTGRWPPSAPATAWCRSSPATSSTPCSTGAPPRSAAPTRQPARTAPAERIGPIGRIG
nr:hypothetical protein [Candidatus Frankia alpina]